MKTANLSNWELSLNSSRDLDFFFSHFDKLPYHLHTCIDKLRFKIVIFCCKIGAENKLCVATLTIIKDNKFAVLLIKRRRREVFTSVWQQRTSSWLDWDIPIMFNVAECFKISYNTLQHHLIIIYYTRL